MRLKIGFSGSRKTKPIIPPHSKMPLRTDKNLDFSENEPKMHTEQTNPKNGKNRISSNHVLSDEK